MEEQIRRVVLRTSTAVVHKTRESRVNGWRSALTVDVGAGGYRFTAEERPLYSNGEIRSLGQWRFHQFCDTFGGLRYEGFRVWLSDLSGAIGAGFLGDATALDPRDHRASRARWPYASEGGIWHWIPPERLTDWRTRAYFDLARDRMTPDPLLLQVDRTWRTLYFCMEAEVEIRYARSHTRRKESR